MYFQWIVLALVTLRVVADNKSCFFPSGSPAPGNVPCNNATDYSTCCSSASACLANGLCLVNNDVDTVEFGRGACTDPTWASPNCFQHCTSTSYGMVMSNGAAVFECDTVGYNNSAQYCCELGADEKTSCCASSDLRFQIGPGVPVGMQTTGLTTDSGPPATTGIVFTSSFGAVSISQPDLSAVTTIISGSSGNQRVHDPTTTNSPASGSTLAAQTTASPQNSSTPSSDAVPTSTGPDDTMVIVIGVSVPLFVLFTALVCFFVWNNRRNSREIRSLRDGLRYGPSKTSLSNSNSSSPIDYRSPISMEKDLPSYPQPIWRSEHYRASKTYELPQTSDPQELDSAVVAEEHSTV